MKSYELMTLAKASVGEAKAKNLSKEVAELIESHGGKVLEADFWGKRKLAYKINQDTEGFYEVLSFEVPNDKLDSLKAKLNLTNNLARYLITANS